MIFDDEYGRLSGSFGLIRAPCGDAAQAFAEWQTRILAGGSDVVVKRLTAGLRSCFETLLPLVAPVPTKHLFVATASRWSLFAQNFHLGTDARGPMIMLSKILNTDALRAVSRKELTDHQSGRVTQYGSTILEYYSQGKQRRAVACANDGGRWVFHSSGDPFEFENLKAYQAIVVEERFSRKLLIEYLVQLGVGYLRDECCLCDNNSPAYLVERIDKPPLP